MSWMYRRMTSSATPLLHCPSIPCSPPHRVRASRSGRCLWREIVSDRKRRRRYWWWGCLFNFFLCVCMQSVFRLLNAPNGGRPAMRWTTWQTSSTCSRCGPPETFPSECMEASGNSKLSPDFKNPESVLPSQCSSSPLFMLQGVRSILSGLPGGLRRVERGDGVHVSRAAPHRPVQPAGAVPKRGVSLPVSALHAAGHQHGGSLRQVKLHNGNPSWFATLQTKTHHTFWQIRITK